MKILKKLTPRYTGIITTANLEETKTFYPGTTIEDTSKTISGYSSIQKVISVGSAVNDIKPGMDVLVDFSRYAVPRQGARKNSLKNSMQGEMEAMLEYRVPVIIIDGDDYLNLDDNCVKFIVDEYEEKEDNPQMGEA